MLHFNFNNEKIKTLLLNGNFGLERENLRIDHKGFFSHSGHPFVGHPNIVYDFCENQIEINTSVFDSADGAQKDLEALTHIIHEKLATLDEPELLWPFSNPPYIKSESDIPIAKIDKPYSAEIGYRDYLSNQYGRYKMSLSGIHMNFSFSDELLNEAFKLSGYSDFYKYKNDLYLKLAERAVLYCWLLAAVTASSPLLDSSYFEKGVFGNDVFCGLASLRCSELGYWNAFTPIFDYSSLEAYTDSIQKLVDDRLLIAPSELYYPIRLKPPGKNELSRLREHGISHIEVRIVDLNPLEISGINVNDLKFVHLLLTWLASADMPPITPRDQIVAVSNLKNAARYDFYTINIISPDGTAASLADAGIKTIERMKSFYRDLAPEYLDILDFEKEKFTNPEKRYSHIIRKNFSENFVEKGLLLAQKQQMAYLNV